MRHRPVSGTSEDNGKDPSHAPETSYPPIHADPWIQTSSFLGRLDFFVRQSNRVNVTKREIWMEDIPRNPHVCFPASNKEPGNRSRSLSARAYGLKKPSGKDPLKFIEVAWHDVSVTLENEDCPTLDIRYAQCSRACPRLGSGGGCFELYWIGR